MEDQRNLGEWGVGTAVVSMTDWLLKGKGFRMGREMEDDRRERGVKKEGRGVYISGCLLRRGLCLGGSAS